MTTFIIVSNNIEHTFIFFFRISNTATVKDKRDVDANELKENCPPQIPNSYNGKSNKINMVDNVGQAINGHLFNNKKEHYTQNNTAVDTIAIDYPELGMADYKMSGHSNFLTTTNFNGSDNMILQNTKLGPGGLNGLSPLNKSQIISRRLKLDLRNECEVPIAGRKNKVVLLSKQAINMFYITNYPSVYSLIQVS